MLGLYLHIPFCQSLCSYCNFNRGLYDGPLKLRYVEALAREIREAGRGQAVDTIFFGGGTPSLVEPAEIAQLIDACRSAFAVAPQAEITLEANPETVTESRMADFLAEGINRISFGVQSFDDDELRRLERIHSAERAAEAIRTARVAGCANLSLDLMLWLPGQSMASWQRTVARAIELEPDHLSMYLLELYPNAPLKEAMARAAAGPDVPAGMAANDSWVQAADDEAADMYLAGLEATDAAGYEQYEISNVARLGRHSRHNLKYWESGAWYGFGAGAHSTVDGVRWRNVSSTADYIRRIREGAPVAVDTAALSRQSRVEEALFTGLRLTRGIDRQQFLTGYGVDPWEIYGEDLKEFVAEGLMWSTPRRFGLTRRGMLVANSILSVFVEAGSSA